MQQASSKSCLHTKLQRPAACKGSLVTQVEPVQSAHLCFLSNHLHSLPAQSALPHRKFCQGLAYPIPDDFDLDSDGGASLARTSLLLDIQVTSMRYNPELFNSKLTPHAFRGVLSCTHGLVESESDC